MPPQRSLLPPGKTVPHQGRKGRELLLPGKIATIGVGIVTGKIVRGVKVIVGGIVHPLLAKILLVKISGVVVLHVMIVIGLHLLVKTVVVVGGGIVLLLAMMVLLGGMMVLQDVMTVLQEMIGAVEALQEIVTRIAEKARGGVVVTDHLLVMIATDGEIVTEEEIVMIAGLLPPETKRGEDGEGETEDEMSLVEVEAAGVTELLLVGTTVVLVMIVDLPGRTGGAEVPPETGRVHPGMTGGEVVRMAVHPGKMTGDPLPSAKDHHLVAMNLQEMENGQQSNAKTISQYVCIWPSLRSIWINIARTTISLDKYCPPITTKYPTFSLYV